jgi:hypothetical protein
MLNPFQLLCAQTYGEGDFAHIESVEQARDVGDTLFVFLMIELSLSEGCESTDEALCRLEIAKADIGRVIDAIDQMPAN